MKKLRVLLVAFGLFLPACYDFDFPLDPKPQVPVDPRLLGAWRCLGEQNLDDAPPVLHVVRQTDLISKWTFESPSSDGSIEKGEYEVHGSTVAGGELLNARELGEKPGGKWSFVRYSFLLPTVLRIQIVDDDPFENAKDAKALRKAVEKKRKDPAIYSDFLICVRPKPEATPSPSPATKR